MGEDQENTMEHPSHTTIHAVQDRLTQRLEVAAAAMNHRAGIGEIVQKTDSFLVHTCRHTSATCDLLLPVARRHLPDGPARVRQYVEQCRRMERAFGRAKQRLYGEAHAVSAPWSQVWAAAIAEFTALQTLEHAL